MRRIGSRVACWLVVAAVTAMLSPVSMSFAAVLNDEVTSQKLKEADGTSGQNTNSGSGVKTGHIQDGAVTSAKIGAGAVTTTAIANGAVTNAKLGAAAVDTTNIIDGAVTDAKITGSISGNKLGAHGHNASDLAGTVNASNLPIGAVNGTVAAGDHNHDSAYQKKYANVIVVAKSGGDFTDPVAAVNSIIDASAANPYLIKIMPGVFNLGGAPLNMKSYVDIEGAGENTTKLIGTGEGGIVSFWYINTSALKSLTIENSGSAQYSVALRIIGCSSINVSNVTALAYGVAPTITRSVYIESALNVKFSNLRVIASGGSRNTGVMYALLTPDQLVLESMDVTAVNRRAIMTHF